MAMSRSTGISKADATRAGNGSQAKFDDPGADRGIHTRGDIPRGARRMVRATSERGSGRGEATRPADRTRWCRLALGVITANQPRRRLAPAVGDSNRRTDAGRGRAGGTGRLLCRQQKRTYRSDGPTSEPDPRAVSSGFRRRGVCGLGPVRSGSGPHQWQRGRPGRDGQTGDRAIGRPRQDHRQNHGSEHRQLVERTRCRTPCLRPVVHGPHPTTGDPGSGRPQDGPGAAQLTPGVLPAASVRPRPTRKRPGRRRCHR